MYVDTAREPSNREGECRTGVTLSTSRFGGPSSRPYRCSPGPRPTPSGQRPAVPPDGNRPVWVRAYGGIRRGRLVSTERSRERTDAALNRHTHTNDDDEAFWRRWLLVEFPNHYPPSERNPSLQEKLAADEALSGVLNWAIQGRKRLLDQGYFTNEDQYVQAKRERWQAWGESVDKFISECVDRDPDAERLTTTEAHRRYAAWCRENGVEPVGQRKFTNTLKDEDVGYKTSIRIHGTPERGYDALGLSEDVPPLDDTPEQAGPPADLDADDTRQDSLF